MSSGVQGIFANTTSIPCNKNHVVHKASKSIDGICAKLQLTADDRKFVDISDVINKQTNHVDDGIKIFASSYIKSVSPDTCLKKIDIAHTSVSTIKMEQPLSVGTIKMEPPSSVEYMEQPSSVEYSVISTSQAVCDINDHYASRDISSIVESDAKQDNIRDNHASSDVLRDDIICGNSQVTERHELEKSKLKMVHVKGEVDKNKAKGRHTTQYNNWHYTDMLQAINAVQSKELSMTAAAKRYHIPRTTLRHYLNDGTNREARLACFSLPKECEDELVSFVIQQRNNPEKILYKMIFEKAKVLSRYLSNGDETKRHSPTPAWIRRFVYRHKQLYDLFPTCLTKFQHPSHAGKKGVTDSDESPPHISPYQSRENGDNTYTATHKTDSCNYRDNNGGSHFQPHCTEIIFPTSTCAVVNSNEYMRGHTSDEYSYESEISHDEFDAIKMRPNDVVKRYDNFKSYSMVAAERNNNHELEGRQRLSSFDFFERGNQDVIPPLKDLHLPKPSTSEMKTHTQPKQFKSMYNNDDDYKSDITPSHLHAHFYETAKHNMNSTQTDLDNRYQLINLSSVPLISSKSTPSCNATTHIDTRRSEIPNSRSRGMETNCLDLNYPQTRLLQDDFHNSNNMVKISEIKVAKGLIEAMEKSIGSDYVQLFTERYRKNKKLERLYCKWLTLKVDLEVLEEQF